MYFFSQDQKLYLYTNSTIESPSAIIKVFNINGKDLNYSYSFNSSLKEIDSLWFKNGYLYIIGENKIAIFKKNNQNRIELENSFNQEKFKGHILGIEKEILYILKDKTLTLLDIHFKDRIEVIEKIDVPFTYKLGVKTNGDYITTGCKIFDIKTLRASRIRD